VTGRRPAAIAELAPIARAAVGRDLVGVQRLAGSSKKGVYRLVLDGGDTVVGYVWSAAENFWPPGAGAADDVFADASGLELFRAAYDRLAAAGVRTPRLLWADASGTAYPADVAVVEDVRGGTLADLLDRADGRAQLAALRDALAAMRAATDTRIGKVARPDSSGRPIELIVLDRALRQLDEAAARVPPPPGPSWPGSSGRRPPSRPGPGTALSTASSARTTCCSTTPAGRCWSTSRG
jgi:hypothetical protein